MGMGDSGDPPVSAVFSGEVVLSRRGSYAGSDVLVLVEVQKAESVRVVSGGSSLAS